MNKVQKITLLLLAMVLLGNFLWGAYQNYEDKLAYERKFVNYEVNGEDKFKALYDKAYNAMRGDEETEYTDKEILKWIIEAAEGEHLPAQNELGMIYGLGLLEEPIDLERSFYWFKQADKGGDKYALENFEGIKMQAHYLSVSSNNDYIYYVKNQSIDDFQSINFLIVPSNERINYSLPLSKEVYLTPFNLPDGTFEKGINVIVNYDFFTLLDRYGGNPDPKTCPTYSQDIRFLRIEVKYKGQTKSLFYDYGCKGSKDEDRIRKLDDALYKLFEIDTLLDRDEVVEGYDNQ